MPSSARSSVDAPGGGGEDPLLRRLDVWRKKRDEKVRLQQEEQERRKREEGECTFKPKLSKVREREGEE